MIPIPAPRNIRSRDRRVRPYGRRMIPTTWREHRRTDDGELIGYVAPYDGAYAAYTLFGYPLAEGVDEADAEDALESAGLRYLAERWLLTTDGGDEPLPVEIIEAKPTTVTVKHVGYGDDDLWGTPFTLAVPVSPQHLRPQRPLNGRP